MYSDCHLFYTFLSCLMVQSFVIASEMTTLIYTEKEHLQNA